MNFVRESLVSRLPGGGTDHLGSTMATWKPKGIDGVRQQQWSMGSNGSTPPHLTPPPRTVGRFSPSEGRTLSPPGCCTAVTSGWSDPTCPLPSDGKEDRHAWPHGGGDPRAAVGGATSSPRDLNLPSPFRFLPDTGGMKVELRVIVVQPTAVNPCPGLVLTARQAPGVGARVLPSSRSVPPSLCGGGELR